MYYEEQQRQEMVRIARQAYQRGLFAGTSGNLSVLLPESKHVLITPSGLRYDVMEAEDIVKISLNGELIAGKHKPSSEQRMHCMVYQEKAEVRSVFHTHSPYATAFAVYEQSIPLILVEMLPFLGGDVPLTAVELPGSEKIARAAVQGLRERYACLLGNHGVITVGETADQAYLRAEYVEDAAKICLLARQLGEAKQVPPELIAEMIERRKKSTSAQQADA